MSIATPINDYLLVSMDSEKRQAMKAVAPNCNIAINSDAGTGKSYLIKAILEGLYNVSCPKVLFLCFNTANMIEFNQFKIELKKKLGKIRGTAMAENLTISTFHRNSKNQSSFEGMKYSKTTENSEVFHLYKVEKLFVNSNESGKAVEIYRRLKVSGFFNSFEAVLDWLENEGTEFKRISLTAVAKFLYILLAKYYKNKKYYSSSDMIGMPNMVGRIENIQKYDYLIIDEAQDTSTFQLASAIANIDSNTSIIVVGDQKQTINTFQGSMGFDFVTDELGKLFGTFKKLNLTTTFRNSQAIIEYVNSEFGTNTKSLITGGVVDLDSSINKAFSMATDNVKDLAILCPINEPLYTAFAMALEQGVMPTYTGLSKNKKDRDMIVQTAIDKLKAFDYLEKNFMECIERSLKVIKQRYAKKLYTDRDTANETVYKVDYLAKMLYKAFIVDKGYTVTDMLDLLGKIDSFTKKCTLTTIHKSKGMTYENTFLIYMEYFQDNGNKKAKNQAFRDYCQKYVACTRAKTGLYFVNDFVVKDENEATDNQ